MNMLSLPEFVLDVNLVLKSVMLQLQLYVQLDMLLMEENVKLVLVLLLPA
jgi:hypothetical protein